MRFLLSIFLVPALFLGGVYLFFKDTAFFDKIFSRFAAVRPGESMAHVFARRTQFAIKEYQSTDHGMLKTFFTESAVIKFNTLADENRRLSLNDYLDDKFRQSRKYLEIAYDKDGSGKIERSEWPKNEVFKLTAMDRNGDGVLTVDEFWATMARESVRAFERADANKDDLLAFDEYLSLYGGTAAAGRYASEIDGDDNGSVSNDEVRSFRIKINHNWHP